MGYLFFSYSRKDSVQANENVESLAAEGFLIWQDIHEGNEGIKPGADFEKSIKNAIESPDCKGLFLQWSEHAQKSFWVGQEITLALAAGKVIYPLLLDDTKLPAVLDRVNRTKQSDFNRLVNHLYTHAQEARRQKFEFRPELALGLQAIDKNKTLNIDGQQFVGIRLLKSSYTEAYVVGQSERAVDEARHVLLCAEFTGRPGKLFLTEALRFFKNIYPDEAYVALHITPALIRKGEYRINDSNYAEWLDAAGTCIEAVEIFRQSISPKLHFFSKMPVALGSLISVHLPTHTNLYLYNDIPSSDGNGYTYSLIARVLTR